MNEKPDEWLDGSLSTSTAPSAVAMLKTMMSASCLASATTSPAARGLLSLTPRGEA